MDAELLLASVLDIERIHLYVQYDRPLSMEERTAFREAVARRGKGEPVQYILGEQEFWSLPFKVNRDVLIPRADTEVLVEEALAFFSGWTGPDRRVVADLGTGSGAISCALASECPNLSFVAGDLSRAALAVASENAARNGVAEQIHFVEGDGLRPLVQANGGIPFDAVVSNPPYITEDDFPSVMREVREWEPRHALTAGPEGTDVIEPLLRDVSGDCLKPGGGFFLEIGSVQQARKVADFLEKACFEQVRVRDDYAGKARVVVATKGSV